MLRLDSGLGFHFDRALVAEHLLAALYRCVSLGGGIIVLTLIIWLDALCFQGCSKGNDLREAEIFVCESGEVYTTGSLCA